MFGLEIVIDSFAIVRRWVYPNERFWSYEPSPETEKWCRFFGFGHEVTEPGAYLFGGKTLVVHPAVYAQLKQEFRP